MREIMRLIVSSLCFAALGHSLTSKVKAKPIIIDTDIYGDVDDVGALAVANVLQNCGLANIKGVAIDTTSKYGALAVSAVNTYFGNGKIPIAALRPLTDDIWTDTMFYNRGDFASKIGMTFPRDSKSVNNTQTPARLYHEVLKAADNRSLTIVSIGFLNNIAALLEDPETAFLLSTKVRELIIMGGKYPSGWEYNFGYKHPQSTAKTIQQWPKSVPVTYVGFELGIDILSGQNLRNDSAPNSPILAAYEYYVGRCRTTRESWDPIAMLYAILGFDGVFEYANDHGYNSITDDIGTNAWVNDTNVTTQHWLKLRDGVSNLTVAGLLNKFYVHAPSGCGLNIGSEYHQEL